MNLYLIRHGESVCNVQRMLYGRTDCALTELGCRQAREVGEKLRGEDISRCVSSPLIRAAETARLALWDREDVYKRQVGRPYDVFIQQTTLDTSQMPPFITNTTV